MAAQMDTIQNAGKTVSGCAAGHSRAVVIPRYGARACRRGCGGMAEQRLRQKAQPAATVWLAAFRRFTHTYAPIPPSSRRLAATWPGSGTALTASELVAETSFTARPVKVTAGVVPVTSPKKFCCRAQSWHDPSI